MSRPTELILELLLLRERYSLGELEKARMALKNASTDPFFRELAQVISEFTPVQRSRVKLEGLGTSEKLDIFLRELKSGGSRKRLDGVAKRLGLSDLRDKDRIEQVTSALKRMSDQQLKEFLRPYKVGVETDQGYQGLASFLIHNR